MISFSWLARLLPIPKEGKLTIRDPITGEEAIIISKRLLLEIICDAYEMGAIDHEHGNADKTFREAYVNSVAEDLAL